MRPMHPAKMAIAPNKYVIAEPIFVSLFPLSEVAKILRSAAKPDPKIISKTPGIYIIND
jgi:hypothetical protein